VNSRMCRSLVIQALFIRLFTPSDANGADDQALLTLPEQGLYEDMGNQYAHNAERRSMDPIMHTGWLLDGLFAISECVPCVSLEAYYEKDMVVIEQALQEFQETRSQEQIHERVIIDYVLVRLDRNELLPKEKDKIKSFLGQRLQQILEADIQTVRRSSHTQKSMEAVLFGKVRVVEQKVFTPRCV